jgi:hypothetical protein
MTPIAEQPNSPARRIEAYLRQIEPADSAALHADALRLPAKRYRVSEIAAHLGLTRQTVHNYATIGLITEDTRTPGGQRLFDESVFPRLLAIQQLKRTHRLSEIRRLLDRGLPLAWEVHPRGDPHA